MNLHEATQRACEAPTLLDALTYICVWESERVVEQARKNTQWETCFRTCLRSVLDNYQEKKDRTYCAGCDNDFYNGNNPYGVKECWHLQSAQVVERHRIRWWTPMDSTDNFTKVTTYSCHTERGKFAFLDGLPEHLR